MNKKLKILYVEDDEGHALLFRLNLEEFDFEIFTYSDELFNYLDSNFDEHTKYYILLDIRLPKLDGLSILKLLKNNNKFKTIDIIIVSSSDNPDEINTAFNSGAIDFIQKPIDFDLLKKQFFSLPL